MLPNLTWKYWFILNSENRVFARIVGLLNIGLIPHIDMGSTLEILEEFPEFCG